MKPRVLDLFAGPGGWDLAAHAHGIDPLGVEWDAAACATRDAAGLRTLRADVGTLDPATVLREHHAGATTLDGLIASPPCQAFSAAGKGEGRAAIDGYRHAITAMSNREPIDWTQITSADERGHLVLEPLRWALALHPRWIACEQVEPVLPLWEATADALRREGYQTWTGVMSAEQYGVPQTRKRAILLASLDGPVDRPRPTHQRYVAPRRRDGGSALPSLRANFGENARGGNVPRPADAPAQSITGLTGSMEWIASHVCDEPQGALFAAPEPERIVVPEDRELLPWVSMAQALGWGMEARPSTSVVCSSAGGGSPEARCMDGGSGTRATIARERAEGRWQLREGTPRGNEAARTVNEPAPTLRGPSAHYKWVLAGEGRAERAVDQPSLSVISRFDLCEWRPTHYDRRQQSGGEPVPLISVDRPAPTIAAQGLAKGRDVWVTERPADEEPSPCGCPWDLIDAGGFCACCEAHIDDPEGLYALQGDGTHTLNGCPHTEKAEGRPASTAALQADDWPENRPATTVAGDTRIFQPGGHHTEGSQSHNAVRVSLAEALVLQSFPPDYPVQGSKTKQYEQVGNAVPPLLAWHVLRAVIPAVAENAA